MFHTVQELCLAVGPLKAIIYIYIYLFIAHMYIWPFASWVFLSNSCLTFPARMCEDRTGMYFVRNWLAHPCVGHPWWELPNSKGAKRQPRHWVLLSVSLRPVMRSLPPTLKGSETMNSVCQLDYTTKDRKMLPFICSVRFTSLLAPAAWPNLDRLLSKCFQVTMVLRTKLFPACWCIGRGGWCWSIASRRHNGRALKVVHFTWEAMVSV